MGPNTLSGHLSVIFTTECQINFAMRLIRPIMRAINSRRSILPFIQAAQDVVVVTPSAEKQDIDTVQEKAKKLVWASGCTSWFIHNESRRNTIMFPDFQYKFWLRSVFVSWGDFSYRTSEAFEQGRQSRGVVRELILATLVAAAGSVAFYLKYRG